MHFHALNISKISDINWKPECSKKNPNKNLKWKKNKKKQETCETLWMGVRRDTDKIGLFASFEDSPAFPPHIKAEIAICLAVCFE